VAFILVLLALTQFKLNFVTCVVLAILVGMTGDNAIHFLLGGSNIEEGIEEKQGASVLTTTIMSLCCVVFFFFSFQPPRILGILLIFGLWGSLAGDLWFLKSLIKTSPNKSN
jgi:predicted RND superfamily exporter protein